MGTINLLYQNQYKINDSISVVIPKVGDILEHEDEYYGLVSMLTAMPIDFMLQLDEMGIDFTTINEYELFLIFFPLLKTMNTRLVFGDLDLTKFEIAVNNQNDTLVLLDKKNDIVIDRAIHNKIAETLRKFHRLEKNRRKPANKQAQDYMLKRAREKSKRRKNRTEFSELESLIIAMVNTEQFKYNFEETLGLTIYQFNESVRQIIKKVDYEHKMHGIYAGTLDAKHLSQDDLNWLNNK